MAVGDLYRISYCELRYARFPVRSLADGNLPILLPATYFTFSGRVGPLFFLLGLTQKLLDLNRLAGVTALDGGED